MLTDSWAGAGRLHSRALSGAGPVALAVALALWGGQPAIAQTAAGEQIAELDEVTVTGTRIRNVTGMDTPTPVAALTADELEILSPTNVAAALAQLPQFSASSTSDNFGGAGGVFFVSPGGGSLNLRGIGTKRTLTLLDSRRVVPATAYGGPDINMFPEQMLRRVEAVTGGASAAYGTDAVSGVVNYILDTGFDGVRISGQSGISDRGDGENQKYSLALGHRLGERAHLLFSAGYSRQKEIIGYESRDWYRGCGLINNPNVSASIGPSTPQTIPPTWNATNYAPGNGGYAPETPRYAAICDMHSTQATYDGMVTVGAGPSAALYELLTDGTPVPFHRTAPGNVQPGGGGVNATLTDATILPSASRKNLFAYLDYDLTDNFTVYGQGMLGWQTLRTFGRVGDFLPAPPQTFTIYRDNAFLPDDLATIMDTAGVSSVSMARYGHRDDWGRGSFANTNRTRSATLGFKGTVASGGFFEGWGVDGYIQYGRNELDAAQEGGIRLDRIYHAVDAVVDPDTGAVRCRVTEISGNLPDCVPLNIFGRGNASPAAVDWIKGFDPGVAVTVNPFIGYDEDLNPIYGEPYSYVGDEDKHRRLTLTQKVFEVTASGQLFEGWAGPISAAVGAHWRKEGIDQKVQASQGNPAADPTYRPVWCNDGNADARCVDQVNRGIRPPGNIGVRGVPANPWANSVEIQFSNVPFVSGNFDVKEVFTETIVPLVSGQPWMQNLSLQGALRWADYAGSGSIWSWKLGLDAALTRELRLRGTYSHDTRAANIAERFDRTGGFTLPINDFLDPLPAGWTNPTAVTTVNGGDPGIEPEEADTFTVGLIYRPEWVPGFSMSVDWLSVSLENAIEQLLAQNVVNLCRDGDQDQCARITRDPSTNVILFVPQTFQNLSESYLEAVDVEFGYSRPVTIFGGGERLGLRLFGTYLVESSITNSDGVKSDRTGDVLLQYFRKRVNLSLNYSNGPLSLSLMGRYNGGGKVSWDYNRVRDLRDPGTGDIVASARIYDVADNTVGSSVYWDTRLGFDIPLATSNLELFANVTNLFDRDPPNVLNLNLPLQVGGGFDTVGRRYVVGFNLNF